MHMLSPQETEVLKEYYEQLEYKRAYDILSELKQYRIDTTEVTDYEEGVRFAISPFSNVPVRLMHKIDMFSSNNLIEGE